MVIKKEILDELLKDKDPKTMFSSEGLLGELKKALAGPKETAPLTERGLITSEDQEVAGISRESVLLRCAQLCSGVDLQRTSRERGC